MTEKTAKQIENLKNQTIGVEVEMNNITRRDAAKLTADFFGTGRWEDTRRRNGYSTWSAWDAQGREWKFQRDCSIAGPDDEKCELVTPILHYADIETLQELIRRLRKAGAKSDYTRGCGVHIHIGAQGHTPQSLRNLANLMASHETLIAEAIKVNANRMNHYLVIDVIPHKDRFDLLNIILVARRRKKAGRGAVQFSQQSWHSIPAMRSQGVVETCSG